MKVNRLFHYHDFVSELVKVCIKMGPNLSEISSEFVLDGAEIVGPSLFYASTLWSVGNLPIKFLIFPEFRLPS